MSEGVGVVLWKTLGGARWVLSEALDQSTLSCAPVVMTHV
jgi:hypothetical protein